MRMKLLLSFFLTMLISVIVIGQELDIPPSRPTTQEEFKESEPTFINFANWLENNPIGKISTDSFVVNEIIHRSGIMAWITQWIFTNPLVLVKHNDSVSFRLSKNPELEFVSITAYVRFSLENNYSKDSIKATVAGIQSAIRCFKKGTEFIRDEAFDELIRMEEDGKLEERVRKIFKMNKTWP